MEYRQAKTSLDKPRQTLIELAGLCPPLAPYKKVRSNIPHQQEEPADQLPAAHIHMESGAQAEQVIFARVAKWWASTKSPDACFGLEPTMSDLRKTHAIQPQACR